MKYIEITIEAAIELLKQSKSQKVMVAIHDLENKEEDVLFLGKDKSECFPMFLDAKTIASKIDEYVNEVSIFTNKQKDLENIRHVGIQKIILFK